FSQERILTFFAQLGGGVLLYTAFIHMLPEIRENYKVYLNTTKSINSSTIEKTATGHSLPLVDLCACAGFFGVFLIEEVMHALFLKNHNHSSDSQELQSMGIYSQEFGDSEANDKESHKFNRSVCARFFDAFLLILAFSVHSIFDG